MKVLVAVVFGLFVISLVYAGSSHLLGNRSGRKYDNDVARNNGHENEEIQKCGYQVKIYILTYYRK